MTDSSNEQASTTPSGRFHAWRAALMRRRIISAALIACVLAAIYWLAVASDRYVSEAHVIIQRTDLAGGQSMDFSGLLAGASSGGRADQLLLRDHLMSIDMLQKLDAVLDLRGHYSDTSRDMLSRMWVEDGPIERFHVHYLKRVSVEFDDYAGVLMIKSQAYDPKTAQAITALLVSEGERFMNRMAHDLASAQVTFLEQQVTEINQRVVATRRAVLDFQDKRGLVSPQATAEGIATTVARLEAQRTDLQTQRSALQAYLVADHPSIVLLNQQISALEKQALQEQNKLAAPGGKTLNRTIEQFQRLEMDAAFAQDVYKTSLVALERGRIEATRTIKKVSVMQAPTLPEYALEPRRIYNIVVFILVALLLAGVSHLLMAIVRDHTD
jgi:capsular polysaccharide transport system permease protein